MHVSATSKKRKWIWAPVAGILTTAIVASSIYSSKTEAMARPSLTGIEQIVITNGKDAPFTILEIVADYKDARIGYLVDGEEPVDPNSAEARNDMAYEDELRDRYKEPTGFQGYTDMKGSGAFNWETFDIPTAPDATTAKTHNAYGNFFETTGEGRYENNTGDITRPVFVSIKDYSNDDEAATLEQVLKKEEAGVGVKKSDQTGNLYIDNVYYDKATYAYEASPVYDKVNDPEYIISLVKFDADDITPYETYKDDSVIPPKPYYNEEYFSIGSTVGVVDTDDDGTADDLDISYESGTVIYTVVNDKIEVYGYIYDSDGNGVLKFNKVDRTIVPFGCITFDSIAELAADIDGNINTFVTIREREASDSGAGLTAYHVSETKELSTVFESLDVVSFKGMGYKLKLVEKEDFNVDRDLTKYTTFNLYYKTNADAYAYAMPNANNHGVTYVHDYKSGLVRTFGYNGGFTNAEWFKKNVLDRENDEECQNLVIDVITKKASDVTVQDIEQAGLVYVTAGDYVGLSEDLNEDVAAALLKTITKKFKAVALEHSVYTKFAETADLHTSNLAAMVALLESSSYEKPGFEQIDDYVDYDALTIDKTKLAGKEADIISAFPADGSKMNSHVYQSVYINNDVVTGTKIIDKNFLSLFPNEMVKANFAAVASDIEEEAFYLTVAGLDPNTLAGYDPNSTVNKVCKAYVLRHILNYGNRRAVSKTELSVLDIEPFYAVKDDGSSTSNNPIYNRLKNIRFKDGGNFVNGTVTNEKLIRDTFDRKWYAETIATQFLKDYEEKINVTGVGTREFIGQLEDLNSTYDLIYIGLDTAYLNTEVKFTKNWDNSIRTLEKTDTTVYNTLASGLVYTHIGDTIKQSNYEAGSGFNASGVAWNTSGNDITPDKLRELKDFVRAGYAVMLSDGFIVRTAAGTLDVNTTKVDRESYMYDFVKFCLEKKADGSYKYYGVNVYSKKDFVANTENTTSKAADNIQLFTKHTNISKLEVEFLKDDLGNDKKPMPYYSTYIGSDGKAHETYGYLDKDGKGYTLKYVVNLSNDAAVDTTNTSYDCRLYIDSDADGRFEPIEKLTGMTIYEVDSNGNYGDEVFIDGTIYRLTTGHNYEITRQVPEGYKGYLSWKLEFVENNRDDDSNQDDSSATEEEKSRSVVRVAKTGACAVPDYASKPTIKILQLTTDENKGNNLNLSSSNNDMKTLYNQVKDFTVDVSTAPVKDYVNKTGIFAGVGDRLDKLNEYDMLVMGFADMWWFTGNANSQEAVLAIREYILSGRSMLFTHDLNSSRFAPQNEVNNGAYVNDWGYWANHYLRDLQGNDRFGVVQQELKDKGTVYRGRELSKYVSNYDKYSLTNTPSYFSGSYSVTAGNNNATLLRWMNTDQYGDIATARSVTIDSNGTGEYRSTEVHQVNEGQITSYPFHIPEKIPVALTHPQYQQLNMQTDYTDENTDDDIVVWYCISSDGNAAGHDYYELDYNDTINNYYIYNKGNITYTGAGNAAITTTTTKVDDPALYEIKLFVNTLVAAYNAGTHAPVVYFKSNDLKDAATISSMYVPYDVTLAIDEANQANGWLNNEVEVTFKAVSLDLKKSYLPIAAEYYVKCTEATPGAVKIDKDFYKKVTPIDGSFKNIKFNNDGTSTHVDSAGGAYLLTNQETYTMKFNRSDLVGTSSVNSKHNIEIYVRTKNIKPDEIKQNGEVTFTSDGSKLTSDEAMSKFTLNFTELYDLK